MFRSCIRKVVVRWSFLIALLDLAAIGLFRLTQGRLPLTNLIRATWASSVQAPITISRLLDPLVVLIPAAILTWTSFSLERIEARWSKRGSQTAETPLLFGLVFGLFGSIIIGTTGFIGLTVGTVISCIVITMVGNLGIDASLWQAELTMLIAVTTIWLLNTLYQGVVAGFIYSISALAVAALTYIAVMVAVILAPPIGKWFCSFMLPKNCEGIQGQ